MASSPFPVLSLLLLIFVSAPTAYTKDSDLVIGPGTDCGPRLLPLVPCAPFVQGSFPEPGKLCCDSLIDIYDQQPDCLCTLLTDPTFLSLPIDQTLALQLPLLCKLAINIATCSGPSVKTPELPLPPFPKDADINSPAAGSNLVTPESPQSPLPKGAETNSSAAVSPVVVALPPVSKRGYGINPSAGTKLKNEGEELVAAVITFVYVGVLSLF